MKIIKEVIPAFQKAHVEYLDVVGQYRIHAWAHVVEGNKDCGYLPMVNNPHKGGLVLAEDNFSDQYSIMLDD